MLELFRPGGGNLTRRYRNLCLRFAPSAFVCCFVLIGSAAAQTTSVSISVPSANSARAEVSGFSKIPQKEFSFLQYYAGAQGLGQRIEKFSATDAEGKSVVVTRLAPGEYTAERPVSNWKYEVDLRPPDFPQDAAYVSWLTPDRGLLMLKDLLPLPPRGADKQAIEITISGPSGWQTGSADRMTAPGHYRLADWSSAVFYISPIQTRSERRFDAVNLSLVSSATWAFTDEDVFTMAGDILRYHQRTIGDNTPFDAMLIVSPFPTPQGADRWAAETRGKTVVLLAGRSPAKMPALAKLSVALTHELFHLWLPNRLNLDGDYAWFYEGFTLYQALRCGVSLGYFYFNDVLNALGRAYDAYRRAPEFDKLTLVQAGERRWTGGNALVYNKGLLVAFLLDANLRLRGNKRRLNDVLHDLFRLHGRAQPGAPAGPAIVAELAKEKTSGALVQQLILSPEAIDLAKLAAPVGLQVEPLSGRTVVTALPKLSRAQRDFLHEFGYN